MAWVFVIVAGLFEVGMALSLKESNGFSRLWPSIGFLVFGGISFFLLSQGLRTLPVGTAYAVWTGIGAAGTAVLGMIVSGDPVSVLRLTSIVLIIAGVVGLRLAEEGSLGSAG